MIVSDEFESWSGVYVDGVLECEGDELRLEDVLAACGVSVERVEADAEWLADIGSLPELFTDVQQAAY